MSADNSTSGILAFRAHRRAGAGCVACSVHLERFDDTYMVDYSSRVCYRPVLWLLAWRVSLGSQQLIILQLCKQALRQDLRTIQEGDDANEGCTPVFSCEHAGEKTPASCCNASRWGLYPLRGDRQLKIYSYVLLRVRGGSPGVRPRNEK